MKFSREILCSIGALLLVGDLSAMQVVVHDNNKVRNRSWSEISPIRQGVNIAGTFFDDSRFFLKRLTNRKHFSFENSKKSENFQLKNVHWSDTWDQYKEDPSEGSDIISDDSLEFSSKDWEYVLKITENNKFPNLRSLKCNIFVGDSEERRINLLDKLSILCCVAPNLEEINLDDCCLGTIPESIKYLANLKKLSLINNRLNSVPSFLARLTKLTDLNLSYNALFCFPSELKNLNNLKRLQLVRTAIEFVPRWIGRLKNLEELNVSSNGIKSLPSEIWSLEKLDRLNLFDNDFPLWRDYKPQSIRRYFKSLFWPCHDKSSEDPIIIGDRLLTFGNKDLKYILMTEGNIMFPNLQRLEVSILSNKKEQQKRLCEKLSEFLYNMPNLKELTISCGSSDLPSEIYELKDLRKLNLSFNKLKRVPSAIGNLKNLIYLNLSNNELSGLTSKIGDLENLVLMNLSDNKLILLPQEIENLKNLAHLDLSNNPQLSDYSSDIKNLSSLRILKLN